MEPKYYFDIAQRHDEVYYVDDLQCFMRLDVVMNVFYSGEGNQEKFVHLEKSKLVFSENDKHILYHKKDGAKLNSALNKLRSSIDKDWALLLPNLMAEESNEPIFAPVPQKPL